MIKLHHNESKFNKIMDVKSSKKRICKKCQTVISDCQTEANIKTVSTHHTSKNITIKIRFS